MLLFQIAFVAQSSMTFVFLCDAIDSPIDIVYDDPSINHRVSAIYFSIKGFIDNNFIGNDFSK